MRSYPLIILIFWALNSWASQDSLLQVIHEHQDTHAVNAYNELGRLFHNQQEYARSIPFLLQGDSLARKLHFNKGLLKIWKTLSVNYGRMGEVEKGLEVNQMGLDLIDRTGASPETKIDFLINRGALFYWQDKIGMAIEPYLDAVKICRENGQDSKRGILLNNLGIFYRNLERYDEALKIYSESMVIRKAQNDSMGMANIYFNMAAAYGKLDSAAQAYSVIKKAEDLYKAIDSESDLILCQLSEGTFLFDLERYDSSFAILSPLSTRQNIDLPTWYRGELHLTLAKIDEIREDYDELENELNKIDSLLRETDYTELLQEFHRLRSIQFKKQDNAKLALTHLEEFQKLSAVRNDENQIRFQKEMETKYLSVEKDYKIAQQEIELLQQQKRRNILSATLIGLLFLGMAIILYLRKRHLHKYELARRDNQLKNEKIHQLEQEQKIVALDYMLKGEEQERRRIAADLHDSLGSLLTSAKLLLSKTSESVASLEKDSSWVKAQIIVAEASDEVRRISHDMMPDALINMDLQSAIEDLTTHINNQGNVRVTPYFLDLKNLELSDQMQIGIYRILQELSQNVLKHANATEMIIQLSVDHEILELVVEDNGVGFIPSELKQMGLGLQNIRSRVNYLNGKINIQSQPGGPTVFDMCFPLA
ncbi:MAG: sensor histidine kinase [Saprospiraceae bacterium]|nr:sensor histidine kinase [Saprospiraceae bacterium]